MDNRTEQVYSEEGGIRIEATPNGIWIHHEALGYGEEPLAFIPENRVKDWPAIIVRLAEAEKEHYATD